MSLGEAEYYEFLRKMKFNPASYKEMANSLMQNGVFEMYHALVNEKDILTLFTIPNLKIFWCCRCHLVADDKSTAHEHLHALVQYDKGHTHRAFKKRLQRSKQRLHPKTTFKKILCSDHAVGVLRRARNEMRMDWWENPTNIILEVFLKDPYFMSVVQKIMVDVEMLGV